MSKSPSHFLSVGGLAIVVGLLFVLVFGFHLGLVVIFGGIAVVSIVGSQGAAKGSNRDGTARFPLMMSLVGVVAIAASLVELLAWRPMQWVVPLSTAILGTLFAIVGLRGYLYFTGKELDA